MPANRRERNSDADLSPESDEEGMPQKQTYAAPIIKSILQIPKSPWKKANICGVGERRPWLNVSFIAHKFYLKQRRECHERQRRRPHFPAKGKPLLVDQLLPQRPGTSGTGAISQRQEGQKSRRQGRGVGRGTQRGRKVSQTSTRRARSRAARRPRLCRP